MRVPSQPYLEGEILVEAFTEGAGPEGGSAACVIALDCLRDAYDQRSHHASVAVILQDVLGCACFGNELFGLHKVAEVQGELPKIGVERGVEGADALAAHSRCKNDAYCFVRSDASCSGPPAARRPPQRGASKSPNDA